MRFQNLILASLGLGNESQSTMHDIPAEYSMPPMMKRKKSQQMTAIGINSKIKRQKFFSLSIYTKSFPQPVLFLSELQ